MPREPRAVIFDLDDTLYPLRRFRLSGFAAVAAYLELTHGVPRAAAFRLLCGAFRRGPQGRELQECLSRLGLPPALAASLVDLMRRHRPSLRLPPATRDVLETLRADWRLGVVTNGIPSLQARKVDALGIARLVDVVVYASEYGSGRGKPDPEPFGAALVRLGVEPRRAVFVGDNEDTDVLGASAVGLHTVLVSPRAADDERLSRAETIVRSIREVPVAVAPLLQMEWSRHVA